MDLTHNFTVAAPIDEAWATFMDLETVGGCFPGATITEVTDDGFRGTVKIKLGPIALVYAGSGTFVERDDDTHRAVIDAKGKDKRGNGTAGALVTIQLTPAGEGTEVGVTTELAVTGKPAQFGRGVMQDVSDKLLQQFVGCIENQFSQAPATEAAGAAETATAATDAADAVASAAASSSAPAAAAPATPAAPAAPAARPAAPAPKKDDAIDLGATVLPVLLKSYGGYIVVGVVAALIGYFIGRS